MSPEARQELLDMDASGMKPADIAKELDLRPQTVYRVLQEEGRGKTDGFNSDRHLGGEQIVEIIEMYKGDATITEICEKHDIQPQKLYALLREAGIPTRQQVEFKGRDEREQDAVTMYRAGEPYWKIQQATGISTFTINRLVHALDLPMRRPRRSKQMG